MTYFSFALAENLCYHIAMATISKQKQKQAEEKAVRRLRIARRSTMYLVRTLLLITMGLILCIAAFLTAERVSNLYILTLEGMSLRADCIVADGEKNDLEEYFTLSFLQNDPAGDDTTYDHYTICSYNYDLSIKKISVLPWSVSATVVAVERMSLKGTVNADQLSEGESAEQYPIPQWVPAKYEIRFIQSNGRWFINELIKVQENPKDETVGTPDPNQTPIPAATPTPTPVETAIGTAAPQS